MAPQPSSSSSSSSSSSPSSSSSAASGDTATGAAGEEGVGPREACVEMAVHGHAALLARLLQRQEEEEEEKGTKRGGSKTGEVEAEVEAWKESARALLEAAEEEVLFASAHPATKLAMAVLIVGADCVPEQALRAADCLRPFMCTGGPYAEFHTELLAQAALLPLRNELQKAAANDTSTGEGDTLRACKRLRRAMLEGIEEVLDDAIDALAGTEVKHWVKALKKVVKATIDQVVKDLDLTAGYDLLTRHYAHGVKGGGLRPRIRHNMLTWLLGLLGVFGSPLAKSLLPPTADRYLSVPPAAAAKKEEEEGPLAAAETESEDEGMKMEEENDAVARPKRKGKGKQRQQRRSATEEAAVVEQKEEEKGGKRKEKGEEEAAPPPPPPPPKAAGKGDKGRGKENAAVALKASSSLAAAAAAVEGGVAGALGCGLSTIGKRTRARIGAGGEEMGVGDVVNLQTAHVHAPLAQVTAVDKRSGRLDLKFAEHGEWRYVAGVLPQHVTLIQKVSDMEETLGNFAANMLRASGAQHGIHGSAVKGKQASKKRKAAEEGGQEGKGNKGKKTLNVAKELMEEGQEDDEEANGAAGGLMMLTQAPLTQMAMTQAEEEEEEETEVEIEDEGGKGKAQAAAVENGGEKAAAAAKSSGGGGVLGMLRRSFGGGR